MKTEQPVAIQLTDYQPFAYSIEQTRLYFDLGEQKTIVRCQLDISRKTGTSEPLVLNGEELSLQSVFLDGRELVPSEYECNETHLILPNLPDQCQLETIVSIAPIDNKALSGLYMSGGRFCTQCEAEGFRHITYYPDRPDVMSRFWMRIEADRSFESLLGNGNLLEAAELSGNRHYAIWEDPFVKPAYLFALVAGSFDLLEDQFMTMSGKQVPLRIYVDPGSAHLATYAMDSLKRAMKWDEDVFGREYDLDLFMIVAVRDFNFGAMENKGLNIFNSSVLLADGNTATDANFELIESVVAHEYFHNWTGNRITCRDWFQLCLKEGLTVFRDQEFSADMRGAAICRIKDVKALRARQFPEDAGPLAHPVRPSSYLAIDNFYTATVYEKGAELIRALQSILGKDAFARGMDHYFATLDGTAATMEEFIACFSHVSGKNLEQFLIWYEQAGTPVVTIAESWDEKQSLLHLHLSQLTPATPGQDEKKAVPIPVRIGLLGENGPVDIITDDQTAIAETVLLLDTHKASWTFGPYTQKPVVSALRGFSAPVNLKMQRTDQQRAMVIAHDTDWFNRWEEAQSYGRKVLARAAADLVNGSKANIDTGYVQALAAIVQNDDLDPAFQALAMQLPSQAELFQQSQNAVPEAIRMARETAIAELARHAFEPLLLLAKAKDVASSFSPDARSAGLRALKNRALATLARLQTPEIQKLCESALKEADNMTASMGALHALDLSGSTGWETVLEEFYQKWRQEPLVLDKWFTAQAVSHRNTRPAAIRALLQHPDFTIENPNRARSVLGAFSTANLPAFHHKSGDGYKLLAEQVLAIDAINPALAARLSGAFESWKILEPKRRNMAKAAISSVCETKGLSKNTLEITSKQLSG